MELWVVFECDCEKGTVDHTTIHNVYDSEKKAYRRILSLIEEKFNDVVNDGYLEELLEEERFSDLDGTAEWKDFREILKKELFDNDEYVSFFGSEYSYQKCNLNID